MASRHPPLLLLPWLVFIACEAPLALGINLHTHNLGPDYSPWLPSLLENQCNVWFQAILTGVGMIRYLSDIISDMSDFLA